MPDGFTYTNVDVISLKVVKENAAFPSPIFKKATSVQRNNMQISCTEFHSNRAKNVGSTNTNSSSPVSQHEY
jgi:hypothetical protein